MNRYSTWRYIALILIIVIGVLYALPNIYGENPAVQITATDQAKMAGVVSKVEQGLTKQSVPFLSAKQTGKQVLVRFDNTTNQLKGQDFIKAMLGQHYTVAANLAPRTPAWLRAIGAEPMKRGLDLRGGIHFLLQVDTDAMLKTRETADLRNMVSTLRKQNIAM